MKKTFILLLTLIIFVCSCKKSELITLDQPGKVDEITYEVELNNATSWQGSYMNENAQVVSVDDATASWKYSFKNTNGLTLLNLTGYAEGLAPGADLYLKIYINGSLVASSWSSNYPQAQYIYP